ncbi:MAG: hypothetical protein A3J83_07550 [Elusimicrobia bacterium RIFOXYA2_FULL_40_6]|nr:MAG: hypothetical protein A3J83_07550 [Elusimicrobia bacterium RIFOXYA2_FULL_40_6]
MKLKKLMCSGLFLFMALAGLSINSYSALVGNWKFDAGVSSWTAIDSAGNFNAVFSTTPVSWTVGRSSWGVAFDGLGDDPIRLGTSVNNLSLSSITIEAFCLPYSTVTTGLHGIYSKGVHYNSRSGVWMGFYYNTTNQTGYFAFEVGVGTSIARAQSATQAYTLNEWHHVAGLSDGTDVLLYVDGLLAATSGFIVPGQIKYRANASATPYGDEPKLGKGYGGGYPWNGKIDEVKIYDHIRVSSEIASDYNLGNIGPTAVGQVSVHSGAKPFAVSYTVTGSTDTDGSISSYTWTFGDGASVILATATAFTHIFSTEGVYVSTLTVADNMGSIDIDTFTITVLSTSGIAGYWQFNEGSGQTLTDLAGGHNGDILGGAVWSVGGGKTGSALQFDGIDDYIRVGSTQTGQANNLNFADTLTVSAWIYPGDFAGNTRAVFANSYNSGVSRGFAITRTVTGEIDVYGGNGTTMDHAASAGTVPENEWHYVTGVFTGSQLKVYIDGQPSGSAVALSGALTYLSVGGSEPRIGLWWGTPATSNSSFVGKIDEVKVYGKALSDAEVLAAYNSYTGAPGVPVATASASPLTGGAPLTVSFTGSGTDSDGTIASYSWNFGDGSAVSAQQNPSHVYTTSGTYTAILTVVDNSVLSDTDTVVITVTEAVPSTNGLMGHWKFDENSGGNTTALSDASGNSKTAYISDTPTWTTGKTGATSLGSALRFDGLNDYVLIGTSSPATNIINYSSSITVSALVFLEDTGITYGIFSNGVNSGNKLGFELARMASNKFRLSAGDGQEFVDVESGNTFTSNTWYYVAGVFTGSQLRLYVNGTLEGSNVGISSVAYTVTSLAAMPKIGMWWGLPSSSGSAPFKGKIDDVRVYNKGISASDITDTYSYYFNQAPTAVISASVATGTAPLNVSFHGDASTDPDGNSTITNYSWNFADGGISITTNPAHIFASTGTYNVGLTVTDRWGATNNTSYTITVTTSVVAPGQLSAVLLASQTSGYAPLSVTFTGSGSIGAITSYLWNFGDATSTSTAQNPVHEFSSTGTFTTVLTVGNGVITSSASISITAGLQPVAAGQLTAVLLASQTSGYAPLTVDFIGENSTLALGYSWDFGDGSSVDISTNPSHTFSSTGTFTVTLTVSSDTETNSASVSITAVLVPAITATSLTIVPVNNYILVNTQDLDFVLTMKNADNTTDTTYTGTVSVSYHGTAFTAQDIDLPPIYTFAPADHGQKGFSIIVKKPGIINVGDIVVNATPSTIGSNTSAVNVYVGKSVSASAATTITFENGAEVYVPANALTAGTIFVVEKVTPPAYALTGGYKQLLETISFKIGTLDLTGASPEVKTNTVLNSAVTITMPYTSQAIGTEIQEDSLRIYGWDDAETRWKIKSFEFRGEVEAAATQVIDKPNKKVSVDINTLGYYSLLSLFSVVQENLDHVQVFPNPYNPRTANQGNLKIKGLSSGCIIDIYNVAGDLIRTLKEEDQGNMGFVTWNGKNKDGIESGRGIYIYHIKDSKGNIRTGKFGLVK